MKITVPFYLKKMVWLHQGNHKGCNEGNPSVLKIVDFFLKWEVRCLATINASKLKKAYTCALYSVLILKNYLKMCIKYLVIFGAKIKLILGHFESQNSTFFGQFGAKIQIFLKDSTLWWNVLQVKMNDFFVCCSWKTNSCFGAWCICR